MPMKNKNKEPKFMFALFVIVGLGVLMGSYAVYNSGSDFRKIAMETEATITRIETFTRYDDDGDAVTAREVYVKFSANGKEYEGTLDYWSPGMREGRSIKVLYHPNNPQNFRSASGSIFISLVMFILGLPFLLTGILTLLRQRKMSKRKQLLLSYGRKLSAQVDDVIVGNTSANDRRCHNIICSYKDELANYTYTYKSENVWARIPPFDYDDNLPKIDVYVDSNDFSKYYVDVDTWLNRLGVIDFT